VENFDGQPLFVNPALCRLLGSTEEELLGKRCVDFSPKEDAEEDRALFQKLRAGSIDHYQLEKRYLRRDGSLVWGNLSVSKLSRNPSPLILAMAEDITDRKASEDARFQLAAIVDSSDDAIIPKTVDGLITSWNKIAQQIFEYTEAEAIGRPITIVVPPELVEEENSILRRLRAGERIEHYETVRISKTGRKINVSLSISPIKDASGRTLRCASIVRDITGHRKAEEALLSSEQRYRLLFEKNVAGVGIVSLDGRVLDCNDGWARILGYPSREEIRGRHALEFYFTPAERQQLLDELFDNQVLVSREVRLKRKDGSPVWVLFNGAAPRAGHDATILQATIVDISERKRAEEALSGMTRKLVESQEQERAWIGRELHDDINQRLAMLAIELEQLKDNPSEVGIRVEELWKQVNDISNDVQTLSRDLHSSTLKYLGVIAGMKSWCKEFGERHGMRIDCKQDVQSPLPQEIGLCLFRVLQEAFHNAAKHSGVKQIEARLWEESGDIHLSVSDLGKGFDIEAAQDGPGLGLTSMRERVRLVNGKIRIDSKPMGGTTIHVQVALTSENLAQQHAAG